MTLEALLAMMNIEDISIPTCGYHFDRDKLKDGASFYYQFLIDEKKVSVIQSAKTIDMMIPYTFAASTDATKKSTGKKQEIFFSLEVKYHIGITIKEEILIEDDLKKAFVESVAPRILHPYFRQIVADSLQKAGLPQLNLPFFENISEPFDHERT